MYAFLKSSISIIASIHPFIQPRPTLVGLEMVKMPEKGLESVADERAVWDSFLDLLPTRPNLKINGDGWKV